MLYLSFIFIISSIVINEQASELELLSNIGMFEVGLAQINKDDDYDIYTINHAYAETYLIYESGKFKPASDHVPRSTLETPLYEPTGRTPTLKDGLNIFRPNELQLFIYCQQCETSISGSLKVPTPLGDIKSIELDYLEFATASKSLNDSEDMIEVKFNLEKNSLMVLNILYPDLSYVFDINTDPLNIHVGPTKMNPSQSRFSYNAADDHTMAWALVNKDQHTDVFMGTGGLRARIDKFNQQHILNERFLIYNPHIQEYEDWSDSAHFKKGLCRTYQATWIDYDNDGDLDLYQGCKSSKNKLYIQQGVGSLKFIESAKKYRLDFKQGDEYHWSDLNQDGYLDFMLIAGNKLRVYLRKVRKKSHVYRRVYISPVLGKALDSAKANILTVDTDNSGFNEIYVSTYNPHNLNENTRAFYSFDFDQSGSVFMVDTAHKFPDAQGHISFVDINFDGKQDLISLEKNILIQQSDHSFKASNQMYQLFNNKLTNFRNIISFDPEINGKWNMLVAESNRTKSNVNRTLMNYSYKEIEKWNKLTHYKDFVSNPGSNWLYIDLQGSTYNQNGIGAKIRIKTNKLWQYIEVMGNRDSFRSQGHYRQYIGLGPNKKVDVEVIWPDGEKTILQDVQSNQLLKVKHPKAT